MTYERQFFTYLENLKRRIDARPLILGGVSTSGGGIGGPAGGFIGLLPQSRVTYDKLEAATAYTPESGMSLLDNLNHIRYQIATISGGGGAIAIQEDDVEVVSAATIINFEGGIDVTDEGGGKVTVVGTASGTGFGFYYEQEDLTSQIPASGDDFDLSYTPVSGTVTVHYNGVTQQFNNYVTMVSGVHTKFSPTSGDELLIEYSRGEKPATITVKSGSTIVTDVTTINLTNLGITDDGAGQVTIIGGVGGGGGATTFLDLTDTPTVYTDQAGKAAVVNVGEDALEFVTVSGLGGTDADAVHVDVANEITGITPKTTPVSADEFVIEDSEATFVKKALTFGNLEDALSLTQSQISDLDHTDTTAIHDNVANEITGITPKTTLVDADEFLLEDSEAGYAKKAITFANLSAAISGSGGGGSSTFIGLTDTPSAYTGQAGKFVTVVAGADAVGFSDAVPADIPSFSGARYYLNEDFTMSTSTGWQNVHFDQTAWDKEYDTVDAGGVYYNEWANFKVPVSDYYHCDLQLTFSPAMDTTSLAMGLEESGGVFLSIADHKVTASGSTVTMLASCDYYFDSSTYYTVRAIHGNAAVQPVVASGSAVTFINLRRLQAGATIGPFVGSRAFLDGDVTIPDDTWTDVEIDYEDYDTNDIWASANGERFTIPEDGYYHVVGIIKWNPWGAGCDRGIRFLKNGSDVLMDGRMKAGGSGGGAWGYETQVIASDFYFDENDYIEFQCWHNRGESINIDGHPSGWDTSMTISKVGRV